MAHEDTRPSGRKRRICIYGGTDASAKMERFIIELTPAIIERLDCVIVSGGVKRNKRLKKPNQCSVDLAVLKAVKRYARTKERNLDSFFQAWIPDPEHSTREHIERMSEKKDGVKVKIMKERSDLGRRLRLVRDIDHLVTFKGKRHTETVLEQALEINRPALPLPFTGGDSKYFWKTYKSRIQEWFPALNDTHARKLERFSPGISSERDAAIIRLIVEILASARFKCLVLLPYDDEHNKIYEDTIEPAVSTEMCPDRLDRRVSNRTISQNFAQSFRECLAIIADVTQENLSVMYEIGYARAKGTMPFLFSRRPIDDLKLPVYLTEQNVMVVKDDDELREGIRNYLRATMKRDADQ